MSVGSELATDHLHERIQAEGLLALAFPVVDANPENRCLIFKLAPKNQPWVNGAHGTVEPPSDCPLVEPDILLIPLLAYDLQGRRLGQGGGYYDTTIAHMQRGGHRPLLIGIAFSCQAVDQVPTEPHDATLDAIATERGIHYVH